jgi:predicted dehydrogenase
MSDSTTSATSRREFLKDAGRLAAASALAAGAIQPVHAAEDSTIRLALIGCGGRGSGAADDALAVKDKGPIKLWAMADVFDARLKGSLDGLKKQYGDKVDVSDDRKFIGFDAYQRAMDCLKPGDVAILATPPAFRWVHYSYAIKKGLNVFMEKPVSVDGPTSRKMLQLADEADKKNLKSAVGLMIRHCRGRQELHDRIGSGEIGDVLFLHAYRMSGRSANVGPKPEGISELMYQIQSFHSFLWASGGAYSDYYIHQIDECSWMKDAWPVSAHALGGRHWRGEAVDQNLDSYAVEYTYPDGAKLFYNGRNMDGCHDEFSSFAHGTKGSAIISASAHTPGKVRTFGGHHFTEKEMKWAFPQPEKSPYRLEWEDLIGAIRKDLPYNEVKRGTMASLVTVMGRMAAHTGHIVTIEEAMNHEHEFAPDVDKLTMSSPAPLQLGPDRKYPVPMPGMKKGREY